MQSCHVASTLGCSCRVGVTSEPDHTSLELTPQDKFIVLASDGVWEFISSKEAVEIISQYETAEESCRQVCDGEKDVRGLPA